MSVARRFRSSIAVIGLLAVSTVRSEPPRIDDARATCEADSKLAVSATASDGDNDLIELVIDVQEYVTLTACEQGDDPISTGTAFTQNEGPVQGLGGAVTIDCNAGKSYRTLARARDSSGSGTTGVSGCCRCTFGDPQSGLDARILAPVLAALLLVLVFSYWFLIRSRRSRT